MRPTKFRFTRPSGFKGKDYLAINLSETRIACGAMFVNGSGRNEQSLLRICHICFLPSFTSFDWGVSEEKIIMWKVNGRQATDDGRQVMAKAHIAFDKVS